MNYGRKERILIVDDEEPIRNLLKKKLERLGFYCDTEPDGLRAMLRTKGARYELILLDINLPFISGTDLLKGCKKANPNMPVVMISGLDSSEIVRKALRGGAYDFLTKPVNSDELEMTVKRSLEHGRLLRKTVEYRKNLERKVEERTVELRNALEHIRETYDTTILALGSALETRDIETQAHGLRVAKYSLCLAKKLGISDPGHLTDIERGAYLHDIGKIGVPDHILFKADSLTDEEWIIMCRHPEIGKNMIEKIEFLKGPESIIYCHHERFDGTGYPQGLIGESIPIEARIFAVADALDAMTSDRPYRKAMPFGSAREIIESESGRQFDGRIVKVFLKIPEEELLMNVGSLQGKKPTTCNCFTTKVVP